MGLSQCGEEFCSRRILHGARYRVDQPGRVVNTTEESGQRVGSEMVHFQLDVRGCVGQIPGVVESVGEEGYIVNQLAAALPGPASRRNNQGV